jgi:hypothetical protein
MAEIADSFESVWHGRTRLYEEVQQLREQLRQRDEAIAELREQLRLRQAQPDSAAAPEQEDQDNARAAHVEERQKLIDFLLDALKQVEQVPTNGSGAMAETSGDSRGRAGNSSRHVSAPAVDRGSEEHRDH